MKSGNLNFLEPSGPLQACNGTALPFFLPFCYKLYLHVLLVYLQLHYLSFDIELIHSAFVYIMTTGHCNSVPCSFCFNISCCVGVGLGRGNTVQRVFITPVV